MPGLPYNSFWLMAGMAAVGAIARQYRCCVSHNARYAASASDCCEAGDSLPYQAYLKCGCLTPYQIAGASLLLNFNNCFGMQYMLLPPIKEMSLACTCHIFTAMLVHPQRRTHVKV